MQTLIVHHDGEVGVVRPPVKTIAKKWHEALQHNKKLEGRLPA